MKLMKKLLCILTLLCAAQSVQAGLGIVGPLKRWKNKHTWSKGTYAYFVGTGTAIIVAGIGVKMYTRKQWKKEKRKKGIRRR